MTDDVITSSAIEGDALDVQQVRSSVARRVLMRDPGGGRSASYLLAAI